MFSWLQKSGDSEEAQSKEYDFEHTTADFSKLLFLASVSSHVSSPDILYSLGPTDEDIEMADEGLIVAVIAEEIVAEMLSQEHVSKGPDVTVSAGEAAIVMPSKEHAGKGPDVTITTTAGEVVADVPSQRHVSLTVHDVHQSKEPPSMITLNHLHLVKQVSCSIILGCMNAFYYCWRYNHASFYRVAE